MGCQEENRDRLESAATSLGKDVAGQGHCCDQGHNKIAAVAESSAQPFPFFRRHKCPRPCSATMPVLKRIREKAMSKNLALLLSVLSACASTVALADKAVFAGGCFWCIGFYRRHTEKSHL